MMLLVGISFLSACDADISRAEVVALPSGFEVRANAPVHRVAVVDPSGRVVTLREVPFPTKEVWVSPASPADGDRVWVEGAAGSLTEGVWRNVVAKEESTNGHRPDQLRAVALAFPADVSGQPNPAMAPSRILLPSSVMDGLFRRMGFGGWANGEAPTAYIGVTLANDGDAPVDLVIEDRIVDAAGRPAPAFRPRLRGAADLPFVAATLRVPSHAEATASLPVTVHRAVVETGVYEHRLVVRAVDGSPLTEQHAAFSVVRGSDPAQAGFVATVILSVLGWLWTFRRVPAWLGGARTSDLAVIASISAIQGLVSPVGMGISGVASALLGPFAPLLTGLLEEPVRIALLAVLLTRVPRPGVAALNAIVGFLLRAMVYGSVGPGEWVYLGASIAITELGLWLAGPTRDPAWRDASPADQWLRFVPVAAFISLGCGTAGFLIHQVFYRLYYSNAFIAAMLLGPSLVYVLASGGWALRFARSLRRIEP